MPAQVIRPALHTISIDRVGGGRKVVVRVEGEIDLATVPELRAAAADCARAGQVTVDLATVEFLDSAGAEALCALAEAVRHRGGAVVVDGVSARARRTFGLLGIDARALEPPPMPQRRFPPGRPARG